MKLLYLSCHSILEYDELKIFEEIGIDYFSLGSYINPKSPVDPIRPPLTHQPDEWLSTHAPDRNKLTKEFVDKFDTILVMHVPEWITSNWELFKDKRVIWRTIGQSTSKIEKMLTPYKAEGMEVCRYSPREQLIEDNIGFDAMIRFYKDPKEFQAWIGAGTDVITIAQDMKHRAEFCNFDVFMKATEGFRRALYGPNNENAPEVSGGLLTYEDMKQKLRDARAYFYTGTQPASYTLNFIEAMMTGIPVVAVGPKFANSLKIAGETYEIPDIIHNGVNGFWSDDIEELRQDLSRLIKDVKFARYIGKNGRETAIELFGKDKTREHWQKYLLDKHYN